MLHNVVAFKPTEAAVDRLNAIASTHQPTIPATPHRLIRSCSISDISIPGMTISGFLNREACLGSAAILHAPQCLASGMRSVPVLRHVAQAADFHALTAVTYQSADLCKVVDTICTIICGVALKLCKLTSELT